MSGYNLVSLGGLFVLMALAWALSQQRRVVNWRCVIGGVALQLALGALVFWTPGSTRLFLWLNDVVVSLLDSAQAGQQFLFGSLASPDGGGEGPAVGFILAFQALPVIVFFSALMGLLYYWRIMPRVVQAFAWVFTRLMRLSGAESLCTASNIFVGIESSTAVRPYLERMTRSELGTILTAGMATVASSTLGVYVLFLGERFPTIAGHLISASVLSAPAALVMSKLMMPEVDTPETLARQVPLPPRTETSAIEAIINGAMAGVKLVVGVAALLLALLGMLALVDELLRWAVGLVGWELVGPGESPLQRLLGYGMAPLAGLIGVPPADVRVAGELLGQRLVATEIPAYLRLAQLLASDGLAAPRSGVIIAYALCGFAHVASLAIFVGGIAALAPSRREDLARVAVRALVAANLACLMVGAVAGVFYTGGVS